MKQIVGAGLAGLIAGHAWPRAQIFEAAPEPTSTHKAVLRFRTDAVARVTGVDFRKVLVRKGLYSNGKFREPDIRLANLYAQKVLPAGQGLSGDRSVWNLAAVERYVAPDNLHERLTESVKGRVSYGAPFDFAANSEAVVSTAPLPVVLKALGVALPCEFHRAPITVRRWRLPGADLFQTVYFPDADTSLFRASITGDMLIAEFADDLDSDGYTTALLSRAFGISMAAAEDCGTVEQRYGKIVNIPDPVRKRLLFQLTHERKIFSLGRFATYRNILLDDVVKDIEVVKRLLHSNAYDLRHAAQ